MSPKAADGADDKTRFVFTRKAGHMRKSVTAVTILILLAGGLDSGVKAQSGSGTCDRACLENFVDRYLSSAARDVTKSGGR